MSHETQCIQSRWASMQPAPREGMALWAAVAAAVLSVDVRRFGVQLQEVSTESTCHEERVEDE